MMVTIGLWHGWLSQFNTNLCLYYTSLKFQTNESLSLSPSQGVQDEGSLPLLFQQEEQPRNSFVLFLHHRDNLHRFHVHPLWRGLQLHSPTIVSQVSTVRRRARTATAREATVTW